MLASDNGVAAAVKAALISACAAEGAVTAIMTSAVTTGITAACANGGVIDMTIKNAIAAACANGGSIDKMFTAACAQGGVIDMAITNGVAAACADGGFIDKKITAACAQGGVIDMAITNVVASASADGGSIDNKFRATCAQGGVIDMAIDAGVTRILDKSCRDGSVRALVEVENQNTFARIYNRAAAGDVPERILSPLRTSDPLVPYPALFPQDLGTLRGLTTVDLASLLAAYGQPVLLLKAARAHAFSRFIGVEH